MNKKKFKLTRIGPGIYLSDPDGVKVAHREWANRHRPWAVCWITFFGAERTEFFPTLREAREYLNTRYPLPA